VQSNVGVCEAIPTFAPNLILNITLNGVTAATMNNQTIKAKVASSFAAKFGVSISQISIMVVARSGSRRMLETASCSLIVTISNMSPAQATTVWNIVNSPTATAQLTQVLVQAGPAVLASVTVTSLQATSYASTQTPHPTTKPTSKPAGAGGDKATTSSNQLLPSNGYRTGCDEILMLTRLVVVVCTVLTVFCHLVEL